MRSSVSLALTAAWVAFLNGMALWLFFQGPHLVVWGMLTSPVGISVAIVSGAYATGVAAATVVARLRR